MTIGIQGPTWLRAPLARQLSHLLGASVSIGHVAWSVRRASFTLHDVQLASPDPQHPTLSFKALALSLAVWPSLHQRAVVLDRLTLDQPQLRLVRTAPDTLDIQPLIERLQGQRAPEETPGPRWHIRTVQITQGQIEWLDRVGERTLTCQVPHSTVQALGSLHLDAAPATPFKATLQCAKHPIELAGQAVLFRPAPQITLHAKVTALPLAEFVSYLPTRPDWRITQGTLDLDVQTEWRASAPAALTLAGNLSLNDGALQQTYGRDALRWQRVHIVLAPSTLGSTVDVHARSIHITHPHLSVSPSSPSSPPVAPPAVRAALSGSVRIDQLHLKQGRLDGHGSTRKPAQAWQLAPIDGQLNAFHLDLGAPSTTLSGHAQLQASLDDGAKLSLTMTMDRGVADGHLAVQQLALPRWQAWAMPGLHPTLSQGWISAQTDLHMEVPGGTWSITHGAADFNAVRIMDDGELALSMQTLALRDVSASSHSRQVVLGALHLRGGSLQLKRDPAGTFNIQKWLPKSTHQASIDPPWSMELGTAQVDAMALDFVDTQRPPEHPWPRATLSLHAPKQTGTRPRTLRGQAYLNPESWLQWTLTAPSASHPIRADWTVHKLPLDVITPTLAPWLAMAIRSGELWGSGQLTLAQDPTGAPTEWGLTGGFSLLGVSLHDPTRDETVLRWSALAVPTLAVDWSWRNPRARQVTLGDLALVDVYARLILSPEGTLNLTELWRKAPTPHTDPTATVDHPPRLHMGTLRVAGGAVHFTDQFIKPAYSAYLSQLIGSIDTLTTQHDKPANLLLTGQVDGDTPLEITGLLQPFGAHRHIDLRALAQGFDLPKISAYSGRWAGYAIEKGKLSADVRYTIDGEQLTAQNRLTINQLTFGEKVTSTDALTLPIRLAVALLKDEDGNIDLNLPIAGTLSDPQFAVGTLLGQSLRNLVVKTVQAPFTLLANLIGDHEDVALHEVTFAPGRATLDPAAHKRLDLLAQCLHARPTLSLDITGHADPVSDHLTPPAHSDTTEALHALAQARAQTARDYLRDTHHIAPDRLWLLAPRMHDASDSASARRTAFTLQ